MSVYSTTEPETGNKPFCVNPTGLCVKIYCIVDTNAADDTRRGYFSTTDVPIEA